MSILYGRARLSPSVHAGFTIIELMIAISVLAMILLLTTMGIVRIGEGYYRGITQANTQQVARSVLDSVSQNIQFSGGDPTGPYSGSPGGGVTVKSSCIGKQRYSYILGYQQTDTTSSANSTAKHTLWKDDLTGISCVPLNIGTAPPVIIGGTDDPGALDSGRELLGRNMRLTNFTIAIVPGSSTLYNVAVTVMYGDDDLIDKTGGIPNMPNWQCKPSNGLISASFCAKSELTTTVGKRLR